MFAHFDDLHRTGGERARHPIYIRGDSLLAGLPTDGSVNFGTPSFAQDAFSQALGGLGLSGQRYQSFIQPIIPQYDRQTYRQAVYDIVRSKNAQLQVIAAETRRAFLEADDMGKLDELRVAMEKADRNQRLPVVTWIRNIHKDMETGGTFTTIPALLYGDHETLSNGQHPSVFVSTEMISFVMMNIGALADPGIEQILPQSRRILIQIFPRAELGSNDLMAISRFNTTWLASMRYSIIAEPWEFIQKTAEAIASDPMNNVIFRDLATCIPQSANELTGVVSGQLKSAISGIREHPFLTDEMRILLESGYQLRKAGIDLRMPYMDSAYLLGDVDF